MILDLAVVSARFIQFSAAAALFGAPLFLVYAFRRSGGADPATLPWAKPLIVSASVMLAIGGGVALFAQTAMMAGDPGMALDAEALGMVITGTTFGYALMARIALALVVLAIAARATASRRLFLSAAVAGSFILASFAWTGHGASEAGLAGQLHAASDIVHLIAAGVWLGALAALTLMALQLRTTSGATGLRQMHTALAGFSGVGALVVAALLASGLANSWFLVGPTHLPGLATTPYGWVLLAKLALFAIMLLLAAINRFRLTPDLGQTLGSMVAPHDVTRNLRRSLVTETAFGLGVVALVAILGTLAPISAQG